MNSSSSTLQALLQRTLSEYPIDQIGKGITDYEVRAIVEERIPDTIKDLLQDGGCEVEGSVGKGRGTAIPWVAIMDPRETTNTQEGLYVVYLFEPQEDRVRLVLGQGVTDLKNDLGKAAARTRLKDEAARIRNEITVDGFSTGPVEFPHASSRNDLYGVATIYYTEYRLGEFPPEETVVNDLRTLMDAYRELVTSGSPPAVYQVPIKGGPGPIQTNYERTILEGIPREHLNDVYDVPIEADILRVWGNGDDTPAHEGDYLLFATRDGRYKGEYTLLARIVHANVLDSTTAKAVTDAVGWGDVTEQIFSHVMFLNPIWEADLEREAFWDLLGFKGWPNDTYSRIDFDRDGSTFFTEYDSVAAFLDEIKGEQMYVTGGGTDNGTSTRYFWINSDNDSWHHDNGQQFYKKTTADGSPRLNQSVFERARPGDKVFVYQNAPTQAIVGRAHVEQGLHAEEVDDRDEPVEGITIMWDESFDGVGWGRLQSLPLLKENPVVETNNHYVLTELSQREYEVIAGLAESDGPDYFLATTDPEMWDVKGAAEGDEVFFTTSIESDQKRQLSEAFKAALPGDRVLFYEPPPTQQIVGEGTVVEGLHHEQSDHRDSPVEGISIHYDGSIEPVDWQTFTSLEVLEGTTILRTEAQGALFPLPERAYEAVRSQYSLTQRIEALRERLTSLTVSVELPDELYFESDVDLRRQIQASLNSGQHIIFTGPPGTGKTKLAKHVCETVADEHGDLVDGYRFTTATAEWTTFDTIGGYVPNRSSEGDELVFQPRLFLDRFRKNNEIRNEWLVIDEINRSDIDKAFGQLFSVLSGDSVQLPYERMSPVEIVSLDESTTDDRLEAVVTNPDIFPVTPSWRLLATMNTYDKTSLYELSYAFMRRFNFIHVGVPPLAKDGVIRTSLLDPDAEENYATTWIEADESLREALMASFQQLSVIWHRVNQHQTIGPSIVRDMLGYLNASGPATLEDPGPALTDAVIALVFPQLEGMRPQDQRNLVDSLTSTSVQTDAGLVALTLDERRLERKAEDFFDLPSRTDE